jgi:hypothetical protein
MILAELAEACEHEHPGGEQALNRLADELKALIASGALSAAHSAKLARWFFPCVASSLQHTASTDPDPAARAEAQALLDENRATFEAIGRMRAERAC